MRVLRNLILPLLALASIGLVPVDYIPDQVNVVYYAQRIWRALA